MLPLPILAAAALGGQDAKATGMSLLPRFESTAPLTTIPPVMVDRLTTGGGLANALAKRENVQGRMLWIDATANVDRYDSDAKLAVLVRQIADSGFNTIVLDVKPISGHVIYRSALAEQLESWKGKSRDVNYDVLAGMLRHAKPLGLSVLVSLNAFSEGHRMFRVGPGYGLPERQTVIYDIRGRVRAANGTTHPLALVKDKADSSALAIFTAPERLPIPVAGAFALTLRPNGIVQDGFEFGGMPPKVPSIPKGGVIVYGTGAAAEFLRGSVRPGERLSVETEPDFVRMADWSGAQIPLMMNPNHPEVRKFALDILREVVTRYPVDGVLYDDRLRYAGINADFSDLTRQAFEKFLGKPVQWPDDALAFTLTQDLKRGIRPGRYYDQWMAWRALVLKRYLVEARQVVKGLRPNATFGTYVGSWYGEYPALGHNYAAPEAEAPFWFLSPNYRKGGSAPVLDLLVPGCYYTNATIYEALGKGMEIGATVESSATLANRLSRDQTWTYAGLSLVDFKDNPEGLHNALQAAAASSQGLMVFDLSHDIEPMWPVFAQAFRNAPKRPPHAAPELLTKLRRARAIQDKTGKADLIPLSAGASGTGQ
ncbi:MAG: family 10 glycosylhydrolase [Fimbriimonas sp.]